MHPFWKYGQRAAVARMLKMSRQNFSNILRGLWTPSPAMARNIMLAVEMVTGKTVPLSEWLFPNERQHPAFMTNATAALAGKDK